MQPASLTAAGLPVLREGEVELVFVSQATLENGSLIRLHLTNMRLVVVAPKGAVAFLLRNLLHQDWFIAHESAAPAVSAQPWSISHSLVSVVDTTVRWHAATND